MTVAYDDIHKPINDLLNKEYPKGTAKLENFTVTGEQDLGTKLIRSELQTKYTDKKNGLTLTQSWNTSNIFNVKAEIADKLVPGLKMQLDSLIFPKQKYLYYYCSNIVPKATVSFVNQNVNAKLLADVFNGPEFNLKTVVNKNGFLVGSEGSFSVENISFKRYNGIFGYANNEYIATIQSSQNLNEFEATFIQNIGIATQIGARAIYNRIAADKPVAIEVGAAHKVDNNTSIKAKINSIGQIGLGISHILSPGIKATIGASIDSQSIQSKYNSVGFALIVES